MVRYSISHEHQKSDSLAHWADRILVLKDGHLIEDGTHQELLQLGGEYTALWNMQVEQYGV
ncbi:MULTISPECIES: hypothetical protein [Dolichospermum]|uniref:Uncharacterized protein n=1 Tax=Dolichospermum heterosporum TAC447 TaxID=747523 RepID=A0ABY5LVN1_9CYAN|nr:MULTISPECIES: hypothetical protein [Dolichospermum]MDK2411198.1 hypothetical protein [Aphanizomenon sp. 202]MDK2460168.1 hypothetical protein [Aphanizomenon sp. PH219]MBE9256815.1 hypothetical protein [Dolichospermum sp. LEGE 00246]UUO15079.1 hypothetical protein NG743_24245 [Dolichospermum heterosporum TAC447]UUO15080.1 hypothetical protein NG743_24250 [Dolichospermum heterosporum TAC447]